MTNDILKIYERFGNFFKINFVKTGNIFICNDDPKEIVGEENRIYFGGKFYSFNNVDGCRKTDLDMLILKSIITKQFVFKAKNNGYRSKGKYKFYKEEKQIEQPAIEIFTLFDGFEFRFIIVDNQLFLSIDPRVIFRINCTVKNLIDKNFPVMKLRDFSVFYKKEENRLEGYLIKTEKINNETNCRIKNYEDFSEDEISTEKVYPEARPELLQMILDELKINYNIIALQRRLSFLDSKTASRDRFLKTLEIIRELRQDIFPLKFGGFEINLEEEPVVVRL